MINDAITPNMSSVKMQSNIKEERKRKHYV